MERKIMPRFQGKAIQQESGKWGWELNITIGTEDPIVMTYPKDKEEEIETKELAVFHMKGHTQHIIENVLPEIFKSKPEGYINLLTNTIDKEIY